MKCTQKLKKYLQYLDIVKYWNACCPQELLQANPHSRGVVGIQKYLWPSFCVTFFLSILSNYLSPMKLTQKNCTILQNFKSSMIKLTKTPILPNSQMAFLYNCEFYHSRIEVLKNCSVFFVCHFLWWKIILEDWEEI